MRIVVVCPYLGPVPGGIEKEIVSLSNEWCALGDEVFIVTTLYQFPEGLVNTKQRPTYHLHPCVHVIRLYGYVRTSARDFQPSRAPVLVPGLTRSVLSLQPDAVLFYNIGWPLTVLWTILKVRRRTATLYRTAYHPISGDHMLDSLRRQLRLRVAASAHCLAAFSQAEKEQIARDGKVNPRRIAVIYPGIDQHQASELEIAAFRASHGLNGEFVLSHVARLGHYKGTDQLIVLLPDLIESTGINVILLLVGRNLEEESLSALVREKKVVERVRFLGTVSDDQLHVVYAVSDAFALPSRYESFGFVFLEAMAHGVPVVGVGTGGVPEIIHPGENGFLLESADDIQGLQQALEHLILDRDLRKGMGECAMQFVKDHFTWARAAIEFKELIAAIRQE